MAQTKIKAGLFEGIIGNGTDGYFLMSNGDGTMTWSSIIINPTIASIAYPGSVTAADPAGGETITVTGTGFKTGATVTIGGTAAPAVSYVSATQITFTTPAKAAGDYDIVVTNTDTGSATFINGISYNGIPTWTTAAGSLGTFASDTTISTITLQATEPDAGTITFSITNGALPTGLSLTGANIDGTTTLETADTLYTFTVTATDDESQATPRTFTITVTKQFISTDNFTINTYTGNGSTQSIEGKIGTAVAGFTDAKYITFPNITGVIDNSTNTDFAISLFFNLTSIPSSSSNYQTMFGKGDPTTSSNYQMLYLLLRGTSNTDEVGFEFRRGYGGATYDGTSSPTTTLSANTWYHLLINYTASTKVAEFFINNSSIGTDTISSSSSGRTIEDGFNIGSYRVGVSSYLQGKVDQFRIFNTPITDSADRQQLAAESNASSTKSTTDIFNDSSGIALYEFEKGAKDTGGVSGYIGSGGIFNGSSSEIDLGNSAVFSSTNTGELSISLWINTTDSDAGYILAKGDDSQVKYEHNLYLNTNGTLRAAIYNSTAGLATDITTTDTVNDGNWHHVVLVIDNGTSMSVYVDNGTPVTSTGWSGTVTYQSTVPFLLGAFEGIPASSSKLNGKLDQVRIFNKAISSSEVTTLYGETSASATKSTTDIFDDGSAVALYELEGNALDTGRGAIDSGQSAVFNGTDSRINLSSNPINGKTNISTTLWLNPNDISRYQYVLSLLNSIGGWNGFGVRISNTGKINIVRANNGTVTSTENSSHTLVLNTWVHIGITSTQSQLLIYINGELDSTHSISGFTTNNTGSFDIGMNEYDTGVTQAFTDGIIDEVRIYDDILNLSEIVAIYNENNPTTANLVAHYKLDGNANDETTNYNGTATSITYSDPAEFPAYDGTATNVSYAYDGTPTNVSFVGTSFQPDFVWIKARDNGSNNHLWTDSIRGVGVTSSVIGSNLSGVTNYNYGHISAFDSNGFTVAQGSSSGNYVNSSSATYVAWCWKAADTTTTISAGTVGNDDASNVRANQDAGFSIVEWSSSGGARTVAHGLNSAPELIIIKKTATTSPWSVYVSAVGNNKRLQLNESAAAAIDNIWGNTNPTNQVFTQQISSSTTTDNIAYCFHSVDGYQKVGSYLGSSSTVTVTTGFEPRFVMIKRTNAIADWILYDQVRSGGTDMDDYMTPNSALAEQQNSAIDITAIPTGFTVESGNWQGINISGGEYIYLAIA
jgi:hypothetical protein